MLPCFLSLFFYFFFFVPEIAFAYSSMEAPTRAQILSRLHLATNPLMAPSAPLLADLPPPSFPSLHDLVSHSGGLSLRCPSCKAPLLRGFDALLCWSCGAPQQQAASALPPVDWRSSLAFQRLLDALDLKGLEKDLGQSNIVEGSSSAQKLDIVKETVASATQVETSGLPLNKNLVLSGEDGPKQENVFDYKLQLNGISLEDFFLGEKQSHEQTIDNFSMATGMHAVKNVGSLEGTDAKIQNDKFLLDSLPYSGESNTQRDSEVQESFNSDVYTFPLQIGDNRNKSKSAASIMTVMDGKHDEGQAEVEDDPFFSWDSSYQSATLPSQASFIEHQTSEKQLNDLMARKPNLMTENPFFLRSGIEVVEIESLDVRDDMKLGGIREMDDEAASSQPRTNFLDTSGPFSPVLSKISQGVVQSTTELDDLFSDSVWQQNVPLQPLGGLSEDHMIVEKDVADDMHASLDNRIFFGSNFQENGMVASQSIQGATSETVSIPKKSSVLFESMVPDSQSSSARSRKSGSHREDNTSQLDFGDPLRNNWQTASSGKANEKVESLLAQLHDLSFMLSDRLLIVNGNKTGHNWDLGG